MTTMGVDRSVCLVTIHMIQTDLSRVNRFLVLLGQFDVFSTIRKGEIPCYG